MNGFKRFCLIVFAIAGILVLAALLLPWVGPWTAFASGLIAYDWYLFVVELFALVCVVGFVALFVVGVRSKRPSDIQVLDSEHGRVTIARSAVASQATYLVEADGSCLASKVMVDCRHDRVDVAVWVEPYRSLDVRAEAALLQGRLREGLTVLVGDNLGEVSLRFLEPRQTADITPGDAVAKTEDGSFVPTAVHKADRAVRHDVGADPETPVDYGVSVPMRRDDGDEPKAPAAQPHTGLEVKVETSEDEKGDDGDGR